MARATNDLNAVRMLLGPAIMYSANTVVYTAGALAFMISIMGSSEMRWIESLIAAALMTFFCVVLFVYLLNLPFQLWPRF